MAGRSVVALIAIAEVIASDLTDHLERRGHDVRCAKRLWAAEPLLSTKGIDVVVVGDGVTPAEGRDLLRRFGG